MSHLGSALATDQVLQEERWSRDFASRRQQAKARELGFEFPKPKPTLESRLTQTPRLPTVSRNRPPYVSPRTGALSGLRAAQLGQPASSSQQQTLDLVLGGIPELASALKHGAENREALDVRIDLDPSIYAASTPAPPPGTSDVLLLEMPRGRVRHRGRKGKGSSSKVVYAREREGPNITPWGRKLQLPSWDEEVLVAPPKPDPKAPQRPPSSVSTMSAKLSAVIWNGPEYARKLVSGTPSEKEKRRRTERLQRLEASYLGQVLPGVLEID